MIAATIPAPESLEIPSDGTLGIGEAPPVRCREALRALPPGGALLPQPRVAWTRPHAPCEADDDAAFLVAAALAFALGSAVGIAMWGLPW